MADAVEETGTLGERAQAGTPSGEEPPEEPRYEYAVLPRRDPCDRGTVPASSN